MLDAQRVILHTLQQQNINLKGYPFEAANVRNDDSTVNLIDAQRIILFSLGLPLNPKGLVVKEPTSMKESDTVKPVITINGDNPQSVKYGSSYTDAGATATDNIDGAVTVQTSGTINTNELGSQYITYTATDKAGNKETQKREVIVKDYATNVTISGNPKTQYQSGESVDLSRGELQITYASGATATIPMSSCSANPSTLTTGTSSISITYNNSELFEPVTTTLSVTVTGGTVTPEKTHITAIEADTTSMKTSYVTGETVSISGLKVYAKRANNTRTEINIDQEIANGALKITYASVASQENKTVAIEYTTTDTSDGSSQKFETSFELTVGKAVENIIPADITLNGYRYGEITTTLTSGTGEAGLTTEGLTFEITKGGVPVTDEAKAKVTVAGTGTVTMKFEATEAGTYIVTPKLGTVTGNAITITVTENTVVTDIEYDVTGKKFIVGQEEPVLIPVTFKHTYNADVVETVAVKANKVVAKLIANDGTETPIELYKEVSGVPTIVTDPAVDEVKYLAIKASKAGTYTISVTVDEKTQTKSIRAVASTVTLETGETQINLYEEEQPDNDNVLNAGGVAYTLVRIQIDENGTLRNLKLSEFNQLEVTDNLDAATTDDRLAWGAFAQDKTTEVTGSGDEVYYIGICAFDRLADLNGKTITIAYPGAESITLTITSILAEKKVEHIVPAQITLNGNRYDKITTTLTSGEGEPDLEATELTFDISKDGTLITDTAKAKVTATGTGTVTMAFEATETGVYTITPKLGEIKGNTITITVTQNETVTDIEYDVTGKKFIVGQEEPVLIPITFKHTYNADVVEPVAVKANKVVAKLIANDGTETPIELYKEVSGVATIVTNPAVDEAKYLAIKASKKGTYTISVTVDGKTVNKSITVTEPTVELKVEETKINLYEENQPDNDKVLYYDELPYTLVRIQINENGTLRNLKLSEYNQLEIKDNLDTGTIDDRLVWEAFGQNKINVTGNDKEVYYIGFYAYDMLADLNGKTITITYPEAEPITLTITSVLAEKKVEHIVPAQITLNGNRYGQITTTLTSGEGEPDLEATGLTFDISKEGTLITDTAKAKVTATGTGTVTMIFEAAEAGIYIVTPKLGEVTGNTITITVTKNETVTNIEYDITDKNFIAGQEEPVLIPITFKHTYKTDVVETVTVRANKVVAKLIADDGTETPIELYKEVSGVATVVTNPEVDEVKYLAIKASKAGTYTISVTVDGKEETREIKVIGASTALEITETQINLYEEEQPDNENVFNDGVAYTLVRVQINENGTLRNLKLSEFNQLTVQDNLDAETTEDRLAWGAYAQDKETEVTGSGDEVYYIGICAFDRLADLNGKTITITYPGTDPITLTVNSVLANP